MEVHISFRIDDHHYIATPLPNRSDKLQTQLPTEAEIDISQSPVICLRVSDDALDTQKKLEQLKSRLDEDAIIHADFWQQIVLTGEHSRSAYFTPDAQELLEIRGNVCVKRFPDIKVPDGPYFIHKNILHTILRVYPDHALAFSQSIWPDTKLDLNQSKHVKSSIHHHDDPKQISFTPVPATGSPLRGHGIAIPARYYEQDSSRSVQPNDDGDVSPLKGLRFTVKDNYRIRGTRTTLGNRAYLETCPIQQTNAAVVDKLLAAGAHLVGKTHLSSLTIAEHPTQGVDFHAPFNPRGDGYLIPGGSSSGSAAAMANYDFLDFAMCTDTIGGARIPALQCGLFGFRPSKGLISDEGVVGAWPAMDTPGWIGRDLKLFPKVLSALTDESVSANEDPRAPVSKVTILYPTDIISSDSPEQEKALKDFLDQVSSVCKVEQRSISIRDDWAKTAPVDEKDLHQYLNKLTAHGWYYAAHHSFDAFRRDYAATHGHQPFVTEVAKWYWKLGSEVSQPQHNEVMDRVAIFKAWFNKQYFSGEGTTLFAHHIDKAEPRYRDVYPISISLHVPGLRSTFLAAMLGAPELAVPISELSYPSRITGREEKLPLVVSLMGQGGTDAQLLQWAIGALQQTGRPTEVSTGKRIFRPWKDEVFSNSWALGFIWSLFRNGNSEVV